LKGVFQEETMRSCNKPVSVFLTNGYGCRRVYALHYSAFILTNGKAEKDGARGEILILSQQFVVH